MEQMKSLTIIGRKWFHRGPGNTYYSCIALVDGKEVATIDYAYGYGNQYEWDMFEKLVNSGIVSDVPKYPNGNHEGPATWCERHGVAYYATAAQVGRKQDL